MGLLHPFKDRRQGSCFACAKLCRIELKVNVTCRLASWTFDIHCNYILSCLVNHIACFLLCCGSRDSSKASVLSLGQSDAV